MTTSRNSSDVLSSPTSAEEDGMRAFLLHGPRDLRPALLPRPRPGPGDVLVRVRRAGICGSDIHYFLHGRIGRFVPNRPLVLGHEFAGEVAELGEGAPAALLGQRVAVDPSIPCGHCAHCREGRYNLCSNMRFFGSASCDPHLDGGFGQFVTVPASNCQPLPDHLGWAEAAMVEPLSVALHAIERAGGVGGHSVLITGGGTIGLLILLAARAYGARHIALADPLPFARNQALALGADHAFDPTDAAADAGESCEIGFEAAGAASALGLALASIRRGGTIVQVGTLPAEVALPLNDVMARELSLLGSFRFANVFPTALALLARGQIAPLQLVSAAYPLASFPEAMSRAAGRDGVTKIQIDL
jgi:L-idonate 5-dehydrogenase